MVANELSSPPIKKCNQAGAILNVRLLLLNAV